MNSEVVANRIADELRISVEEAMQIVRDEGMDRETAGPVHALFIEDGQLKSEVWEDHARLWSAEAFRQQVRAIRMAFEQEQGFDFAPEEDFEVTE